MSIVDIKQTAEHKMARTIETFKVELQKIRTGRAHPGLLDQVHAVITDDGISPEYREGLQRLGIEVIVAEPPP